MSDVWYGTAAATDDLLWRTGPKKSVIFRLRGCLPTIRCVGAGIDGSGGGCCLPCKRCLAGA
eukprot:11948235-Karenia_brevis.AAC.1